MAPQLKYPEKSRAGKMAYLYVVLKECAIHSLLAEGGKRSCFAEGRKTYLVMVKADGLLCIKITLIKVIIYTENPAFLIATF